jgi:eukaryotic-like serine/threonine-protein kinase
MKIGDRLGPYEVLAPIGAGGMGEVYRAHDSKLDRDVAIKVLPSALAQDAERLARFEREAKILASLNHPNIAAIYGVEESGSVRALVIELVPGESLKGPLPLETALNYAKQIADALEAAHDKSIVHRDLKPANIMITPAGVVKVLDFGLAAVAQSSDPSSPANSPTLTISPTRAGMILGTAAYMSPEQARGKAVDKRADIWAFGVVLYEMLAGKRLFEGETVSDTLAQVLTKEPDWERVPAKVRRLLKNCLEKDPKRRLRDIGDAWELLEDSEPATTVPSWSQLVMTGWVAAAVLAVALGVALWAPWRARPAAAPMNQFVILPPEKASFSLDPSSLAISPDGRQIVFAASGSGGAFSLWVRPLDSLAAHELAGTEDGIEPFWSPDGRSIGFFARGKLQRIEVSGGPAQALADASFPVGGAWSRGGVIVFAPRLGTLYRVLAAGGDATPATYSGERGIDGWPSFLPDGRHFLFHSSSLPAGASNVYVGSLDSRETKPIIHSDWAALFAPPGYLLFLRGSTLIAQAFDADRLAASGDPSPVAEHLGSTLLGRAAFSVSEAGSLLYAPGAAPQTHLVWMDRSGKQISEAAPPGDYGNPELSKDGKRVAFDRFVSSTSPFDVWLLDLERRITSRFTFQSCNVPAWSPDGNTVVFATVGNGGVVDLAQRPSNMGAPEQILLKLNAPPILFPSDWSSDGRYLAYYRTDPKTQLDLWILPLFGDRKPFAFARSEFNESQGQFSPDGKWLSYVSDEGGTPQIYVQSFPAPGGKWQVSTTGGSQPRWRRDGKELFYVALDRKLMAVPVKTGAAFEADTPRALFQTTLPTTPLRQAYSAAPDGQRFLLAAPVEAASSPMTIIENWTAALKK